MNPELKHEFWTLHPLCKRENWKPTCCYILIEIQVVIDVLRFTYLEFRQVLLGLRLCFSLQISVPRYSHSQSSQQLTWWVDDPSNAQGWSYWTLASFCTYYEPRTWPLEHQIDCSNVLIFEAKKKLASSYKCFGARTRGVQLVHGSLSLFAVLDETGNGWYSVGQLGFCSFDIRAGIKQKFLYRSLLDWPTTLPWEHSAEAKLELVQVNT